MTIRKDNGGESHEDDRSKIGERSSESMERERDETRQISEGGRSESGSRRRGRGSNLTDEDRARGGERSAEIQQRDEFGQFAGTRGAPRRSGGFRSRGEREGGVDEGRSQEGGQRGAE